MTSWLWARMRQARYALPGLVERCAMGPDDAAAARIAARLRGGGLAATLGYFHSGEDSPEKIAKVYQLLVDRLQGAEGIHLSLKAPPMHYDMGLLRQIAGAGVPVMFDAHAPDQAEATLAAVEALLPDHPGTGCVIPARWARSADDAARFRDTSARIRLVKGEWPDPAAPDSDIEARYVALASLLAGRAAPVAVATHKPALAEAALAILRQAGTPCELEQLRGLPRRRTVAVARKLGVPVRIYVPFGPGWWPYAIDKALARPYLPCWMLRDLFGRPDR